jgi:tRNA (guanine-N7-)-methyltransferase
VSVSCNVEPGYKMLSDLTAPLNLAELFGREAPVELEIGAGRGDFILDYAQQHNGVNFLAVERKQNVLKKMVNKLTRAGVHNVQVLNVEILHLLQNYLPPQSFQAVHIYFPDPWPKKGHVKRRLVRQENLELILRALVPGGFLHFRTDHPVYNSEAMQLFAEAAALRCMEIPSALAQVTTGYERRFLSQGTEIHRATFVYQP